MTKREAKILAAGDVVAVDGVEYRLRPIVAQHLCDLETDALRFYKRQVLTTYVDAQEIFDSSDAVGSVPIEKKVEELAQLDLDGLPEKKAYDTADVPITDRVRQFLKNHYPDLDLDELGPMGQKALLAMALDQEKVTLKQVEKWSQVRPRVTLIRYDQWWITGTTEGQLSFVTSSIRHEHPEITKKDVARWPLAKLAEAATKVEKLTTVDLGNT